MKRIPAKKILCICPIGIGNYLLMYPAVARLRQSLPQAKVHLLALRNGISEFATKDPLWDQVHCFDPTKIGVGEKITWIRKLRSAGFDSSLAFFPSNKREYALLPFFCGVSHRFAFSYPRAYYKQLNFLQNHRIDADITLHDTEQNLRLADFFTSRVSEKSEPAISATPSTPSTPSTLTPAPALAELQWPVLWDAAEEAQALDWLQEHYLQEPDAGKQALAQQGAGFQNLTPYIAVHPGSSIEHGMDAKRWEPEKFGQLLAKAQRFLSGWEFSETADSRLSEATRQFARENTAETADSFTAPKPAILIFGGPDEEALKEEVQKHALQAGAGQVILVPVMKLGTTACLLGRSLFCLCNDSGLMHIASASGAPVAALFGPTDEKRNGPVREPFLILRKEMEGYPCWTAATAGDRESGLPDPARPLREFSAEEAWDQLSAWLKTFSMQQ